MNRSTFLRRSRRVTTGFAPVLRIATDVNPRADGCCIHCRGYWQPADCPIREHAPCLDCPEDVA